jgi:hypothetical protein
LGRNHALDFPGFFLRGISELDPDSHKLSRKLTIMQKTFVKIISKKILTTSFTSGTADPSPEKTGEKMEIAAPVISSSLEFTAVSGDLYFFRTKIENPQNETILVEVRNDDGDIVFSKMYEGTFIDKKIRLLNEHLTALYKFTIKPLGQEAAETFVVSISTRMLEEALS